MDLTDFLLARLAEEEAGARAAHAADPGGRPARVLATCAAQRHVVDAYREVTAASVASIAAGLPFVRADTLAAAESSMASVQLVAASTYDRVLRWHAEAWADHPDYRDDWRP